MKRALVLASLLACIATTPASRAERWLAADTIVFTRGADFPDDPDKLARCDWLARGEASRIWLGYMVELPPDVTDGSTGFRLIDGFMGGPPVEPPPADIDVSFFAELGDCAPAGRAPVVLARHFGPGEERGVIPAGSRHALVTLGNNPTATFIFEIVE